MINCAKTRGDVPSLFRLRRDPGRTEPPAEEGPRRQPRAHLHPVPIVVIRGLTPHPRGAPPNKPMNLTDGSGAPGMGCGPVGAPCRQPATKASATRPDPGTRPTVEWRPDEGQTWRAMVQHIVLMDQADLSYPIILSSSGAVMDGMHRVAKALREGRVDITAVQFEHDPEPDHVGRTSRTEWRSLRGQAATDSDAPTSVARRCIRGDVV